MEAMGASFVRRSPEIHLDGLAGGVIEDQYLLACIVQVFRFQCDLPELSGCDAARALESGTVRLKPDMHVTILRSADFLPG